MLRTRSSDALFLFHSFLHSSPNTSHETFFSDPFDTSCYTCLKHFPHMQSLHSALWALRLCPCHAPTSLHPRTAQLPAPHTTHHSQPPNNIKHYISTHISIYMQCYYMCPPSPAFSWACTHLMRQMKDELFLGMRRAPAPSQEPPSHPADTHQVALGMSLAHSLVLVCRGRWWRGNSFFWLLPLRVCSLAENQSCSLASKELFKSCSSLSTWLICTDFLR